MKDSGVLDPKVKSTCEGGMTLQESQGHIMRALNDEKVPTHIVCVLFIGDILERPLHPKLHIRYCRRKQTTRSQIKLCEAMERLTIMADKEGCRLWFVMPPPRYDLQKYLKVALIKQGRREPGREKSRCHVETRPGICWRMV